MDDTQRDVMVATAAAVNGKSVRERCPQVSALDFDRAVRDLESRGLLVRTLDQPALTRRGREWVDQTTA